VIDKKKITLEESNYFQLQVKAKVFDEIYALFKEIKHGELCEFDFNDQVIEILEKFK